MAQYPPPGQPEYPPPPGFPPGSGYPPGAGYPPPPGYQPPQGYGAPPGQPGAPQQPVQRRSGCRGCLFGCLAAFLAVAVLATVVFVAGVFMFRRAFPTAESFGEASTCAALRIVVTVLETGINQADMSAAERAEAQQMLREMRAEFERECAPTR